MKIGIHKLGFPNHDYKALNENDKNGMFAEVNLLIHAFLLQEYDVEYVNTDIINLKEYDHIFCFNGFENGTSKLSNLKHRTKELNYLLTDSRFFDISNEHHSLIDNIFKQGAGGNNPYKTYNSNLHKLPIFEEHLSKHIPGPITYGRDRLIFGGSVRDRSDKVFEYLIGRDEVDAFLKTEGKIVVDNRLPIDDYKKKLYDYSYGLVLINPKDVACGNITWRYFEYVSKGVLTFVDRDSDPYNQILNKNDFMYVSSYEEMKIKMFHLSHDENLMLNVIFDQLSKIDQADILGETFTNSLLGGRKQNDNRQNIQR